MRKIYAIEVIERKGEGSKVIHTTVLPDIPVTIDYKLLDIEMLKELNNNRNAIPSYKLAVENLIYFTINYWFPKHFYRIALVDWKYY